jgi:superkiller protein 3
MEQGKWFEALAAVERADKLLAAAGRADRPPRLLELHKALSMAQRLEDIYHGAQRVPAPVPALLGKVGSDGSVVLPQPSAEEEFFWGRQQDPRFAKEFQDFGIDVDALEPAEVATRIVRTTIREALVRALDNWATVRMRARGDKNPGWQKLVEIARQADPNDLRNRCRDALLRRDRPALEQLADAVPIRQLPPSTLLLLGQVLMELGARDKAVAFLRQAQHQHPDDMWINNSLGWYCWQKFQPPLYEDAIRFYSINLALQPHHAAVHGTVAQIWLGKGDVNEAIAEYSRVIDLTPGDGGIWVWINRGHAYFQVGQYDKAGADFSKAVELDPKSAMAHCNLGATLSRLGKLDEAIAAYRKAIELDPKFAPAHYNLGIALRTQGNLDEALAEFRKAAELDPRIAATIHGDRGIDLQRKGRLDEAIVEYRMAVELNPKIAWIHFELGKAMQDQVKLDEAIAEYRTAIELDPKNAWIHGRLGNALRDQGKLDGAIAEYRTAIELDPKLATLHGNLGIALQRKGRLDEAVAEFRKAVELDPNIAWIHANLGVTLQDQGKLDEAIAEYRKAVELDKAIKLDPKNVWFHRRLGNALRDRGKLEEAIAEYTKAIELDPRQVQVLNSLAWLLATCPDAKIRNASRAVGLAKKATELDSQQGPCWKTLGAAHYRAGHWKDAVAALEKSMELRNGGDAFDWFFLAMAHWQLGAKDEAHKWYDKAVEWMDKNAKDNDELRRFRSEAEEVLEIKKK